MLSPNPLVQLIARLTDRRIAVERELSSLGSANKGSQDIFKHCRGFERSFQVMLGEANVAFKIRAVVEGNLPETLRKIPIEKRFNKGYTREVRCVSFVWTQGFLSARWRGWWLPSLLSPIHPSPLHTCRFAVRLTVTSPTWSPLSAVSSAWWPRP